MAWAVLCLAIGTASSSGAAEQNPRADENPTAALGVSLPDGNLRRVLERMPARDRQEVLDRATAELDRLRLEKTFGDLGKLQSDATAEDVLTVETARFLADQKPSFMERFRERLKLRGSVSPPRIVNLNGNTLWAKPKAVDRLLERAEEALGSSQYIYRPRRPKGEGDVPRLNRLFDWVDRTAFKSVVGVAKRNVAGQIEIYCSGLLITPTVVVTAAHCVKGPDAPKNDTDILVLTQFTNGAETVLRAGSSGNFTKVSTHAVKGSKVHDALDASQTIWKNDLAVLILNQSAEDGGFAGRATTVPKPVVLTAAGWGKTDAPTVNGVALEVTTIRLSNGVALTSVPPSLLSWPFGAADGAGVCQGDSGGPVFVGDPDGIQSSDLRLIGLVAAGNTDCRSGEQLITDLTNATNRGFVCKNAVGASFCS